MVSTTDGRYPKAGGRQLEVATLNAMRRETAIRVVGGSVAGLTVALSLIQSGLANVQVLEAIPDGATTQGGGALGVTRGTVASLKGLGIDPSEYLSPFLKPQADGASDWAHVGHTSWPELHRALRDHLPDGVVRGGMRLRSHSPTGTNRSALGFANGERDESELTIFADGRNSTGRRLVGDQRKLQYAACAALRGQAMPPAPEFVDRVIDRKFPEVPAHFGCRPLTRRQEALPPGQESPLDWFLNVNLTTRRFQELAGDHPALKTFIPPQEITATTRAFIFEKAEHLPDNLKSIIHNSHVLQISPVLDIAPPTTMTFKHPEGAPAVLLGDALAPQRPQTAQGMNLTVSQSVWFGWLAASNLRGEISESELFQRMDEIHLPMVTQTQRTGVELCEKLSLGAPPDLVVPYFNGPPAAFPGRPRRGGGQSRR